IVARTENGVTTRYGYDGAGDAPAFTTGSSGGTLEPTIGLGGQALGWGGADRHLTTTVGATSVTYARDAIGRIVARTENGVTTRYGYDGAGDAPPSTTLVTRSLELSRSQPGVSPPAGRGPG
ncbi:MAG: hypothetical protein ACRD0M_01445, partial [Acidimicrobiales bacterium]